MPGPYVGDYAVAGVWNSPGGASYSAVGDNVWYQLPVAEEVVATPSGFGLWCELTAHGLVLLEDVEIVDFFVTNLLQSDTNQRAGVVINGDTSVLISPPLTADIGPAPGIYPAGTLFEAWGNRNGTSIDPLTSPSFNITISEYVPPVGGIYVGQIVLRSFGAT